MRMSSGRARRRWSRRCSSRSQETPDPRLKLVLESLVRHLHGFLRETRLTEEEWRAGIDFLTAAGHITDDAPPGVRAALRCARRLDADDRDQQLRPTRTRRKRPCSGRSSSRAPRSGARRRHRVRRAGRAVLGGGQRRATPTATRSPGAVLEIWECDEDGFYDVQHGGDRTAARGRLRADADGQFPLLGADSGPYPIPHDGPVGQLLEATSRSPMRAPHLHFLVSAPGKRTLITHIFVEGEDLRQRRRRFRRQGVARARVRASAAGHADAGRARARRSHLDAGAVRHRARAGRRLTRGSAAVRQATIVSAPGATENTYSLAVPMKSPSTWTGSSRSSSERTASCFSALKVWIWRWSADPVRARRARAKRSRGCRAGWCA